MATTKRLIRSHKGGRTARAPEARMTPQERDRLDTVLEQRGVKHIDWYIGHVNADYAEISGDDTMSDKADEWGVMEDEFGASVMTRQEYDKRSANYDRWYKWHPAPSEEEAKRKREKLLG